MGDYRSKEKFDRLIKDEVTKMFEGILNYAEVACSDERSYKVLRKRVLKMGNDCIRQIIRKSGETYDISYSAIREDIVKFGR